MSKVILIDSGSIMFRSIFNYERMLLNKFNSDSNIKVLPPHYTYLMMILSALKKIGVDREDKVIICLEGKSWRKLVYAPYKAQRKDARESHKLINWDEQFSFFNDLHDKLNDSTNWFLLRHPLSEADDIISCACRYFKDEEKIIVSSDGDLKQLCYYPSTHFFTVTKKCKGSNGVYEFIPDPLKIISDKSKKGDVSDNILVCPDDTEEDEMLRYDLVNLLKLPDYIENDLIKVFDSLQPKQENLNKLPFKNLAEKYLKIYEKDNVITPDYCSKLLEKRKLRKKKLTKKV